MPNETCAVKVTRYQYLAIVAAQVIDELIEMRAAQKGDEQLGLTSDDLTIYDTLEVNDNAVKVLGDEAPRTIATSSLAFVRKNVTIDRTVEQSVRAKLRVIVKRILSAHVSCLLNSRCWWSDTA